MEYNLKEKLMIQYYKIKILKFSIPNNKNL